MNKLFESVYYSSPVFLQNCYTSLYGIILRNERYGGIFKNQLNQLLTSQWYNEQQIYDFQLAQLKQLVLFCEQTVPFYQILFKKIGFKSTDIKSLEDIKKIPVLTKDTVRENAAGLLSKAFKISDLVQVNTSGTTGTPLCLKISKKGRILNYAFFERFKLCAGVNFKSKSATFAGRVLVKDTSTKPPFWRSNIFFNNTQFSSYHLSQSNIPAYLKKLASLKPEFIDSYPSSIYALAQYIKEHENPGIFPKVIITSSETLYDYQRICIEDAFKCKIYDQYGSAEQVSFISQCEKGSYHCHPEYGINEIIDNNGNVVSDGYGELICTGFTNYAMPFLRYRIGDTVLKKDDHCACGRKFTRIDKIIGRSDDVLRSENGAPIGRLDPIFKGISTNSIQETQIIQDNNGITVRIVKGNQFSEDDAETIVNELKKRAGKTLSIKIEFSAAIERTANGKFKAVICKLPPQKLLA